MHSSRPQGSRRARSSDRSCERPQQRGGEKQAFGDLDSRAMPVARNAADPIEQPPAPEDENQRRGEQRRSEEHTSELQSLMRISYAVFCLKKKTTKTQIKTDQ